MNQIYGTIDPGIIDVVNMLRANGIDTSSSCEGGDGHQFPMPTVLFDIDAYDDIFHVKDLLIANGYRHFTYCVCRRYYNEYTPEEHLYGMIEFNWKPVYKL